MFALLIISISIIILFLFLHAIPEEIGAQASIRTCILVRTSDCSYLFGLHVRFKICLLLVAEAYECLV